MLIFHFFGQCGEKKKKAYDEIAMSGLTTRTENLKTNIKAFANKGTLIGQMYGTLSGMGWNRWECDSDRCDMKALCGYRPAANGYELAGIDKTVKRIYLSREGLNFHRRSDWPEIFAFMGQNMHKMEKAWKNVKPFFEE